MGKNRHFNKWHWKNWIATYLKNEFIADVGVFDEEIIVPYNSFLDYSFRGITHSWQYYDIDNAFLYKIGNGNLVSTSGEEETDWEILQRKWGMNSVTKM